MKKQITLVVALAAGYALAQTCIVPAPAAPPLPTQLVVNLPPNGATVGCTVQARVPGSSVQNTYAISNAKCATAVAIALQAAAIDNGWADGGTP